MKMNAMWPGYHLLRCHAALLVEINPLFIHYRNLSMK
jgi:hypothetical protein